MRLETGVEAEKLVFQNQVSVDPYGSGDFTSITDALAYANSVASSSNLVGVLLSEGNHIADNGTAACFIGEYVHVRGQGKTVTNVTDTTTSNPVFELNRNASIAQLSITTFGTCIERSTPGSGNQGRGISDLFGVAFVNAITAINIIRGDLRMRDVETAGFGTTNFVNIGTSCITTVGILLENSIITSITNGFNITSTTGYKFIDVSKCVFTGFFGTLRAFTTAASTFSILKVTYSSFDVLNWIYDLDGTCTLIEGYNTQVARTTAAGAAPHENVLRTRNTGVVVTSNFCSYYADEFNLAAETQRPATYYDLGRENFVNRDDSKSFVRIDTWKYFNLFGGN